MTRLAVLFALLSLCACATTPKRPPFENTSPAYEQREQPVTETDVRILERAADILASEAVWDRHDTRQCAPKPTRWSLFCALQQASIEIAGAYDHRRVALQEVRFAIEDLTNGKEYEHRLMDFNNEPERTFADVRKVLSMATERVKARLAK